jgi:CP family cyanate transporter-like MFS transporter
MSETDASAGLRSQWVLVAAIALVAFNLRPALASVGPLVEAIRAGTGLSSSALGLLTTLPLLAFGFLSLFASRVSRRIGLEGAIGVGLLLITVGTALRAAPQTALLFAGTGLLGVGVALGNVLVPALAKRSFPSNPGPITSLYSSMMGVGATLAAGLSVPLAGEVGWRWALGLWALPGAAALAVWAPRMTGHTVRRRGADLGALAALVRAPVAWQVAFYMGLQSTSFYVLLAWLPALLQSQGVSEGGAGGLLALSQVTGIAGSAVIPVWAGGRRDQRVIVWSLAGGEAVGLAGLLLTPPGWAVAWVLLLGFVLGGTFALALTFLVVRSDDAETAAALSGMVQSVGYLLAALGPPVVGALRDATGGWRMPLVVLFGVLAAKTLAGVPAGRPATVTLDS